MKTFAKVSILILVILSISFNRDLGVRAAQGVAIISVEKTMTVLGATTGLGTITSTSDRVRVSVRITNTSGDTINKLSVYDEYDDTFTDAIDGDWDGPCHGHPIEFKHGEVNSKERKIKANETCVLSYTIINPTLPINKTRLVSFPTFVSTDSVVHAANMAVGYLFFVPPVNQFTSGAFISDSGDKYDFMSMLPGATITISGTTITSPNTYMLFPLSNNTSGNSGGRKCGEIDYGGSNRGGTCLLNADATVSVANMQIGRATAELLVSPKVTVVGGAYAQTSSSGSNIIMPGQHVASNTISDSTAAQIIDYGGTGTNMWDPSVVFKNVNLNANINRIKNLADLEMREGNYSTFTNVSPITDPVTNMRALLIDYSESNGKKNPANIDLSNTKLRRIDGTTSTTRKDGYVLHVKGNLIIRGDSGTGTIKNLTKGTIIADGYIRIENLSIDGTDSVDATKTHPLGLIALGNADTTGHLDWVINSSGGSSMYSKLNHVALFAKDSLITTTNKDSQSVYLNGMMAASVIDFSGVKTSSSDSDILNLGVVYDQSMSTNAPPGFSIFTPTPVLNDK